MSYNLIGKFFLQHCGGYFKTGEIIEQVTPEWFVIQLDKLGDMPREGAMVTHISAFQNCDEHHVGFEFFDTSAERDAFADDLREPPPEKVTKLKIVKHKTH